jgi:ferredoxin
MPHRRIGCGPPDWARRGRGRAGRFHPFVQFGLPVPVLKFFAASIRTEPWYRPGACDGCGVCLDSCPGRALSRRGSRIRRDREACLLCFGCVAACPRGTASTRRDPISAWNKRLARKFLR